MFIQELVSLIHVIVDVILVEVVEERVEVGVKGRIEDKERLLMIDNVINLIELNNDQFSCEPGEVTNTDVRIEPCPLRRERRMSLNMKESEESVGYRLAEERERKLLDMFISIMQEG